MRSHPLYLQAPSRRPPWLGTERLLGEWSVPADPTSGRRMFAAQMEPGAPRKGDQEYKPLQGGGQSVAQASRLPVLAASRRQKRNNNRARRPVNSQARTPNATRIWRHIR